MTREQNPEQNYGETCPVLHPADRIQKFFIRPFFLTLTIGIPFCIFKGLFGLAAIRVGTPSNPILAGFGWCVIAWASIDFTMNAVRAAGDLLHIPTPLEYCTLAELGRLVRRPMVFLAVDTLLSFSIICLMLWSGWILQLTQPEAYLLVRGNHAQPDQHLACVALQRGKENCLNTSSRIDGAAAQVLHDPVHDFGCPGQPDMAVLGCIPVKRRGIHRQDLNNRTGKD